MFYFITSNKLLFHKTHLNNSIQCNYDIPANFDTNQIDQEEFSGTTELLLLLAVAVFRPSTDIADTLDRILSSIPPSSPPFPIPLPIEDTLEILRSISALDVELSKPIITCSYVSSNNDQRKTNSLL